MLRTLGADLVGMSTVLEAIAARAEGVEVFGLSLVTNLAAGMTGEPLDHQEVLEAGAAAAGRMGELLRDLIARLRDAAARPARRRHPLDRRRPRSRRPATELQRVLAARDGRRARARRRTSATGWPGRCASAPRGCAGRCGPGRPG